LKKARDKRLWRFKISKIYDGVASTKPCGDLTGIMHECLKKMDIVKCIGSKVWRWRKSNTPISGKDY